MTYFIFIKKTRKEEKVSKEAFKILFPDATETQLKKGLEFYTREFIGHAK